MQKAIFRLSRSQIGMFVMGTALLLGSFVAQGVVLDTELQQSLFDKAQSSGSVRVIVGMNTGFSPEGGLSISQAVQQQQNISDIQNTVVQKMAGSSTRVIAQYKYIPYMALEVDAIALQRLFNLEEVSSVEEDVAVPPIMASSNPVIGSNDAWAAGYTGSGWTVAVLDTGVDKTHSYFNTNGNKVVSEACYSNNNSGDSFSVCPGGVEASTDVGSGVDCVAAATGYPNSQGSCQHGTHVAGSAAGNDTVGPNFGVAKESNIIAVQVFSVFPTYCGGNDCLLSWSSDQISGLERVYELRNDFNIAAVNMSLGGGQYFSNCDSSQSSRKAAIDNLRSVNIATVIAAGNNGYKDSIGAPACISTAVSVGATDDADNVASFSNIANFIDLLAPGVSITSSVPGGGTGIKNGTSMATPHVAGAWAVLKQAYSPATVDNVLTALKDTGTSVDDQRSGGTVTGMPRINVGHSDFFPNAGVDDVPSLGKFGIRLTQAKGQEWLSVDFCPGDPNNPAHDVCLIESPVLYDPNTKIGRSNTHPDASVTDETNGTQVCETGTNDSCTAFLPDTVKDGDFSLVPNTGVFTEGPSGTQEVHTQILSLNMTDLGTSANAVRAGSAASDQPRSIGEVESRNQVEFFPAESFFDVFVEVDFDKDMNGTIDMTLYNKTDDPLVIQNGNLTQFPPKVVYIHDGTTTAPPIYDKATDEQIGWITIAGHGVNFSQSDVNEFNDIYDTIDEEPTLVTLTDFTATKLDGSVLIEWQTDMEIDNAGFHLWRSEEEDGEYIRITNSMIPAQGSGSQYSYLDEDAIDDITYYYKLEDIDLYGVSSFHGPISSTAYILITPAEGAVLPIRTPATFEWVDSEDIEGYKLQFSNQSDFSGKVVTRPKNPRNWITSNVYTPTEQKWRAIKRLGKKGQTIFWRVLGKIEDETVIYSETGSFTLEKTH